MASASGASCSSMPLDELKRLERIDAANEASRALDARYTEDSRVENKRHETFCAAPNDLTREEYMAELAVHIEWRRAYRAVYVQNLKYIFEGLITRPMKKELAFTNAKSEQYNVELWDNAVAYYERHIKADARATASAARAKAAASAKAIRDAHYNSPDEVARRAALAEAQSAARALLLAKELESAASARRAAEDARKARHADADARRKR